MKNLEKICNSIIKEHYAKADPSADIDVLIKTGVTAKHGWYQYYCISKQKSSDIIQKHILKNKLSKVEVKKIHHELFLGALPRWEDT